MLASPKTALTDVVNDYWQLPNAELLDRLEAKEAGLGSAEAEARARRFGPNVATEAPQRHWIARVRKRLMEPLVAILLVAAAISAATGDWPSSSIILVIIVLSVGLDVFQEHRAEDAAEALKRLVAVNADVRRDGTTVSLPVAVLVPGDVVELKAGDLVPADGVVLVSQGAHANEALLTGEPYAVEKKVGPSAGPDAFNALFGGTSIVSGEATMLVVATGARTRFGGIAAALQSTEPPSAFERGIHRLGVLILRLTSFLVLFVLLANLALGRPALEVFPLRCRACGRTHA